MGGDRAPAAEAPPRPGGGRPRVPGPARLAGIRFVLKYAIPWRAAPRALRCGSGMTCWRRLGESQVPASGRRSTRPCWRGRARPTRPAGRGRRSTRSRPSAARRAGPFGGRKRLYADRGYDSKRHREELRRRHVAAAIARRKAARGSGSGKIRRAVERPIGWSHQYRGLGIRYARDDAGHQTFMALGRSLVCLRLTQVS